MYRIHVMISGDVQGVFFRISSQDKANELNLTGCVKNIFNNDRWQFPDDIIYKILEFILPKQPYMEGGRL